MLENINKNNIKSYDDMIYRSRPVKLDEFISDKYNIVHRDIYNYSLINYLYDLIISNSIITEFMRYYICFDIESTYNDNYSSELDAFNSKINNLNINSAHAIEELKTKIEEKINTLKQNIISKLQDNIEDNINENLINDFINSKIIYINSDKIFDELQEDEKIYLRYFRNGKLELFISDEIKTSKDIILSINNLVFDTNNIIKNIILKILTSYIKKSHKFIEIKNSEYWKPSSVIIIDAKYPYSKKVVNLEKYWNNYQSKKEYDISKLKITKDENITDSSIEEINYITGKAKMYSKMSDINYEVDFKYIDENLPVNDDLFLSNTFTYKYNNKYNK